MNRQKSLDVLQFNQQEAQRQMDRKKQEVNSLIYITENEAAARRPAIYRSSSS